MKQRKTNFKEGNSIKWIAIISLIVIIFAIPLFSISYNPPDAKINARSSIYIASDEDFTSINGVVSGDGTENNPYILSDWIISATSEVGIYIKDTTSYFIILNCDISGGGANYDGIYLENVENGRIEQTDSRLNRIGLRIINSENITLIDSRIFSNQVDGIRSSGTNNMVLNSVLIYSNGLIGFNVINNNYNVSIWNSELNSNGQGAVSISYTNLLNFENNSVNSNGEYGFVFSNCNSITIKNNSLSIGSGDGFTFYNGINLKLDNCSLLSFNNGIKINQFSNIEILNTTSKSSSQFGIVIENSKIVNINNNTIKNNIFGGISLTNVNNTIIKNSTIDTNNGRGYNLERGVDHYIEESKIEAIEIIEASDIEFMNNNITKSPSLAHTIICDDSNSTKFHSNQIYGYIDSKRANGLTIEKSDKTNGIYLEDGRNILIANNNITDNTLYTGAITLIRTNYTTILNNFINGSSQNGIYSDSYLKDSIYVNVIENKITHNAYHGIRSYQNYWGIIGNNITHNGQFGISLAGLGYNVVCNNISTNYRVYMITHPTLSFDSRVFLEDSFIWGNLFDSNERLSGDSGYDNTLFWKEGIGNYWVDYLDKYPDADPIYFYWSDDYLIKETLYDPFPTINHFNFIAPDSTIVEELPEVQISRDVFLNWSGVENATKYKVYRSNNEIVSLSTANLIATIDGRVPKDEYSFTDANRLNGTYYYIILATHYYKDSEFSNQVSIQIGFTFEGGDEPEEPERPQPIPSPASDYTIVLIILGVGVGIGLGYYLYRRFKK